MVKKNFLLFHSTTSPSPHSKNQLILDYYSANIIIQDTTKSYLVFYIISCTEINQSYEIKFISSNTQSMFSPTFFQVSSHIRKLHEYSDYCSEYLL